MKSPNYKVKIGIVGCGAIGSRMAVSIVKDLNKDCRITGLYDTDPKKVDKLARRLRVNGIKRKDLPALINHCDCMIEATNAANTRPIIQRALKAKKSVLAMSVGKLLDAEDLFRLAKRNKCYILLPSGAIAGVDTIKAASLAHVKEATLTTRKSPASLHGNPFFQKHGIDLMKIKKETTVFDGSVHEAVKYFPQNINVAATLSLALGDKRKLRIKLMVSPNYTKNSHEIKLRGDFGTMVTRTDNVVCPDNPKTSYLAVLSGLQTLKQYCTGIVIGT